MLLRITKGVELVKAFLIDPEKKEISEVDFGGYAVNIYQFIDIPFDCARDDWAFVDSPTEHLDHINLPYGNDAIWSDRDAEDEDVQLKWELKLPHKKPIKLINKALVLGGNDGTDYNDPTISFNKFGLGGNGVTDFTDPTISLALLKDLVIFEELKLPDGVSLEEFWNDKNIDDDWKKRVVEAERGRAYTRMFEELKLPDGVSLEEFWNNKNIYDDWKKRLVEAERGRATARIFEQLTLGDGGSLEEFWNDKSNDDFWKRRVVIAERDRAYALNAKWEKSLPPTLAGRWLALASALVVQPLKLWLIGLIILGPIILTFV